MVYIYNLTAHHLELAGALPRTGSNSSNSVSSPGMAARHCFHHHCSPRHCRSNNSVPTAPLNCKHSLKFSRHETVAMRRSLPLRCHLRARPLPAVWCCPQPTCCPSPARSRPLSAPFRPARCWCCLLPAIPHHSVSLDNYFKNNNYVYTLYNIYFTVRAWAIEFQSRNTMKEHRLCANAFSAHTVCWEVRDVVIDRMSRK